MEKQNRVVIEDFSGSESGPAHRHLEFWAIYDRDDRRTYFGGMWSFVPYLKTDDQPTIDEVHAWANQHGGWQKWFEMDEKPVTP